MPRHFPDWISTYVQYASVTEAPKRMHFWTGISAIAGAIRRRGWIDMKRYVIYPNFYIVLVAPPGVIAKSTTVDVGMRLLRQVPAIKFGPDTVTWPALVVAFSQISEAFQYGEDFIPMSAMTLEASEFGSLVNPADREMISLYITLWDGRKEYIKATKTSGSERIDAPWINMIACTTPHWIADNMPTATIGGGFTSRCIFVYGDAKERFIAFVDEFVDEKDPETAARLVEDLTYISTEILGPFTFTAAARDWERKRYEQFWKAAVLDMTTDTLEGYAARKQTHIFKTALILSASHRDDRVIDIDDLQLAAQMLDDLEPDMQKVFSKIGRTEDSIQAERFIEFVKRKGEVTYAEAYSMIHTYFPDFRDFEGIMNGAIRSGQLHMTQTAAGPIIRAGTYVPPAPDLKIVG